MIKFNEVTWYSKLAAIIFFIGILPALTFYIGMRYQHVLESSNLQVNIPQITKKPEPGIVPKLIGEEGCYQNSNYFVITKDLSDSVGSNILVKYKKENSQKFDCTYTVEKDDFELKNAVAEYLMTIEGNFLITDAGTGPGPRGIQIYDLNFKKEVFKSVYSSPIEIKDGLITYWKPTNEAVTKNNCPKLDEYTASGLGVGIESHVALTLSTLSQRDLSEKRCSPRQ
ncbi:MAG: hypothetical protein WC648_03080 [Candidatus Paceibacterota bacterium]|jgi:hypothetical protein